MATWPHETYMTPMKHLEASAGRFNTGVEAGCTIRSYPGNGVALGSAVEDYNAQMVQQCCALWHEATTQKN